MRTPCRCAPGPSQNSDRRAKTALGGDNRAGCTLAAELAKQDHPPITLLFCVREESRVKTDELGSPTMASALASSR